MADISFPAHLTVQRQLDVDGLPILEANIAVADEVAGLELPQGPAGERGRQGRPRTTSRKMGEIATAAERPSGLGAADRGKWWHRLDTNGMDVWTGTAWRHSPDAVGPKGTVADANTVTAETVHERTLTQPAAEFEGTGAQLLRVTAPAGQPGAKGPAGASGAINESPDFDQSLVPVPGGTFAYHPATRMFRPQPLPMAAGPWVWFNEDFAADQAASVPQLIAGTFTVPAQSFAWRPVVYGHMLLSSQVTGSQYVRGMVRIHHSQGQVAAATVGTSGAYWYQPIIPTYRDEQTTKTLSPSSTFAVVPAGQPANLVVTAERGGNGSGSIGYKRANASLVVYAQPI
ncbi:hypothetical protein [Nocardia sp. CC201C]|uniref:hypothetical protein n=1 Tax=Nocardia sp. CC201C TaxID=3044575 RepID=UPI0024A810B0|nr:hypothetical protein [Nocardia sp. CC201C]